MVKRILLIEDEVLAAERTKRLLHEIDASIQVVGEANSVKSAIQWIKNNPGVDLILADIELKDGQVFEVFRAVDIYCPVVFITSYDEYSLQAIKVNCLDYLLKPVRMEDLKSCLKKYDAIQKEILHRQFDLSALLSQVKPLADQTHKARFLIRQGSKIIPLEAKEAAYFYAEGRYAYLKTWEGKNYIVDHTLEELEAMVDPLMYFRANRALLVHANAVKQIQKDLTGRLRLVLHPSFNEEIYISKEKSSDFKKWMDQ